MTNIKCTKCGQALTGNGKLCAECNVKDGHKFVRDTLQTQFNQDFKEKYRSECHSFASITLMILQLDMLIIALIAGYFSPEIMYFLEHSIYSILGIFGIGLITYPLFYFYQNYSLRKKFINSYFKEKTK